jgi:hypothetical protein
MVIVMRMYFVHTVLLLRERPGQSMHRAPVTTHEQAERRVIAALTRGQ